MNKPSLMINIIFLILIGFFSSCSGDSPATEPIPDPSKSPDFIFGADLSYVNQILDHGGVYKDNEIEKNPYQIFADHGTNVVRLRLWYNPKWTKEVYENGTQLYNDLNDVERSIKEAKTAGMEVLLDFHYSDTWTDPGMQNIPEAWRSIISADVLEDSIYNYTSRTLSYLGDKDLMPEYVQIGNEINCGMFITDVPEGFPSCNVCDGEWETMGAIINSAIQAVRDVSVDMDRDIQILLHVADPVNVAWWFDNMTNAGGVSDFDIIGFSYYPIWHTGIPVSGLAEAVKGFIGQFNKKVMILETAYPWTTEGNDDYNNLFNSQSVPGYPVTPEGQLALLRSMTQQMINGGGSGIFYWEPAWISSDMKDLYGTGSSWENNAFFDFEGNVNQGMTYMEYGYDYH